MKILPVGAELFRADRHEANNCFSKFVDLAYQTRQSQKYFNNAALLSAPNVSTVITMHHQAQTYT
jgi:hypothetical protein